MLVVAEFVKPWTVDPVTVGANPTHQPTRSGLIWNSAHSRADTDTPSAGVKLVQLQYSRFGRVDQLEDRLLRMQKALGSIPNSSIRLTDALY